MSNCCRSSHCSSTTLQSRTTTRSPSVHGWTDVASGKVRSNGVVGGIEGRESLFEIGFYELRLHVAEYYRARGVKLPEPAFMGVQVFRFGLADMSQHYHLPVKLTPWGSSCFRGGA
ncbi:hydroxyisourate hydrolase [Variovorax sp. LjRoot130]|uniref:hydroxyisourate hydrolase n=1 Tax=unclassified Variovorax TaxID=663243 RepID=UPI003ECE9C8B